MSEPIKPISVTTVLDYFATPWLVDWKLRVGKKEAGRISKAAMKIGSRTDEIIKSCHKNENYYLDYSKKDSDEVKNCCHAYVKWAKVYQPKSVTPCTRLFATIDGIDVTGEPDLMVDDVLVDIKCSSKISLNYWLQVNMYRRLQGNSMDKVAILRLDKTTASYEYAVKDYDPRLVDVWCGLLKAYCYYKGDDDGGLDIQES